MAVSLVFGILFAALITLLRVPVACLIVEDPGRLGGRIAGLGRRAASQQSQ